MRRLLLAAALSSAVVVLSACAGPGATSSPNATATAGPTGSATPGAGGTTVNVTVQEFSVLPEVATAPAGDIKFVVTNTGPDDVHEFVVIRTDLAPDALPTDDKGAVTEEGQGMTVVDEIEDIAVGDTAEMTVTLDAGAYVLICNIYDESEQEAHYQMGMYTGFTVE